MIKGKGGFFVRWFEMFICIKCGICCKNIDKIPELREFDAGDGVCVHLTKDHLCDIYLSRPDICNVDKMFEVKYRNLMTKEQYEKLNAEGCKLLQANNE